MSRVKPPGALIDARQQGFACETGFGTLIRRRLDHERLGLDRLTFTRFVAAFWVVVFHFGGAAWPFNVPPLSWLTHHGPTAVSYFYCLSGFIMTVVHGPAAAPGFSRAAFWRARAARIVPVFLLTLWLAFALSPRREWPDLLWPLAGLQAWRQSAWGTLNPPAWSISVELFFYALFPWLRLGFAPERLRVAGVAVAVFWLVSQAVHAALLDGKPVEGTALHDWAFYNPLLHLNQFLCGMWAGAAFLHRRALVGRVARPRLALAVLVLALAAHPGVGPGGLLPFQFTNGLAAPLFLWAIVSLAAGDGAFRRMAGPGGRLLGEASYAVYLLQFPVWIGLAMVWPGVSAVSPTVRFWLFFALLVALSVAVFRGFERPARAWLRGRPRAEGGA